MTVADRVPAPGLHRVGARPPLMAYLQETWQRRDFAITLAKSRLQAANEENRLGVLWIGLRPIINAIVYGSVFGLLQGDSRPDDYTSFVIIGVFMFEFFSSALSSGARSITGNRALVQSLAFPRITLPIAAVIEQFLSLLVTVVIMLVLVTTFGATPSVRWLLLVPLIALYTLFNTGVALICARLTVMVTDLSQLLPFVTRLLMYTSGVLFQPDKVLAKHPTALALFQYNPIHEVLVIARGLLLPETHAYDPAFWGYLAIWSVVVLVVGVLVFWVAEEKYGRVN